MIYVIRSEGTRFLKVGFTAVSVGDRLKSLQTGSSNKLTIVDVIAGSLQEEQFCHFLLKDHIKQGEWFELTDGEWFEFRSKLRESFKEMAPRTPKKRVSKSELLKVLEIEETLKYLEGPLSGGGENVPLPDIPPPSRRLRGPRR